MDEQAMSTEPDMRRDSRRERITPEQFAAEFEKLRSRRKPTELNAIVVVLGVEKYSVRECLIRKVPGMRMLLVKIADTGEKPSSSKGEAPRQTRCLYECFLDPEMIVR